MAAAPASPTPIPDRRSRPAGAPPARASSGQPRLRVVAPPRRTRRWLATMLVTALLGVAGVTSLSAASADAAFTASELRSEITELERVRTDLTGDVAELSSVERIRRVAEDELGLVPADEARYLEADPVDQVPAAHHTGQPADPVKAAREGRW